MSSLVASASIWTNDDSSSKKRQSTMRKALRPKQSNMDEYMENEKKMFQNSEPTNFEDLQNINEERSNRVNELLDKITSADTKEENSKMTNFKPIEHPSINIKKDMDDNTEFKQYIPPMPSYIVASNAMKSGGLSYGADDSRTSNLSNYKKSYEPPVVPNKPYYANMGIGGNSHGTRDDGKLMEKINYMIHLLEQQHNEKTNNITEEFILYTFLGVFIIYICDSFARSGKYIR